MEKPTATPLLPYGGVVPSPPQRGKRDTRPPLDYTRLGSIERFGLIRELARGGMGQVFLARDTRLGRKVAIKFLLRDDPSFVARFLVEARATARCTHENIVTIYEAGEHAGLPFMVLEYLEGTTLAKLMDAKIAARAFTELMVPVASALDRAHEHGIVHRDLKPSNIFVTDRGVVKVLDFGVAKCFEHDDREPRAATASPVHAFDRANATSVSLATHGDSYIGTAPYMSPEQWGVGEVDHASDIWAVGIMFWRALTGEHPTGTLAADRLRERLVDLETPLPSIATKAPSTPPELVSIIDRCLAMHPTDRYRAAELLADLRAYLQPHAPREHECPYRGLASFGESDAKFFFGRSAEIRSALGRLEHNPVIAIVGPSGIGKSSFVHAGLVPALRASGDDWRVRVVRPGRTPISSLAALVDEDGGRITDVISQLATSPGLLGEVLREEAARHKRRILVVIDQLEELFTLGSDAADRQAFMRAVLAAADDPSAPVRVVLSMRADFLDRLAGDRQFGDEISRALFFLSAPDRETLRETVVRPAELAGYTFENDWIVDDLLSVATSRGALPLLQFAAMRLWDGRDRARKLLTCAAYDAMGGVGGAFARHADEIAAAVPVPQQPLLRVIMTRLVTPEGTRGVIDRAELASLGDVDGVLDHLVRGRLVLAHTDPTAGATVELVHEVLITEWPMLVRWLEDGQAARGFAAELRTAARQWVARGKPADLVWRGATALEALALARRHVLDLSANERDFFEAIRIQVARGRKRKLLALVAAFTLIGIVLAAGSIAYLRIARAEGDAQQQAMAAETEAKRARQAEAEAEQRLRAIEEARRLGAVAEQHRQTAEAAADVARDAASKANAEVALSRDELQRALEKAVAAARVADAARKLAEQAKAEQDAANRNLEKLLAAERSRSQKLQQELDKIYSGRLK